MKPRLSLGWLTLRATRLPFLSATLIPVGIGIAIAAVHGSFDLPAALLTVIGAAAVHLGLNVANDVFDAQLGADDQNVNPTQYSGGSRVIQYGLVSLRRMATISVSMYAVGVGIGLVLLLTRYSPALLTIGVLGLLLSLSYTAPPLKLVYRGLGELTTAIGFGPLMLVGAYVVQSVGVLRPEPFVASLPIALLVMLILYVNEVPDRQADARAGKRTLPVRMAMPHIVNGYFLAALAAFAVIALRSAADPVASRAPAAAARLACTRGIGQIFRPAIWADVGHGRQHPGPPVCRCPALRLLSAGARARGRGPRSTALHSLGLTPSRRRLCRARPMHVEHWARPIACANSFQDGHATAGAQGIAGR